MIVLSLILAYRGPEFNHADNRLTSRQSSLICLDLQQEGQSQLHCLVRKWLRSTSNRPVALRLEKDSRSLRIHLLSFARRPMSSALISPRSWPLKFKWHLVIDLRLSIIVIALSCWIINFHCILFSARWGYSNDKLDNYLSASGGYLIQWTHEEACLTWISSISVLPSFLSPRKGRKSARPLCLRLALPMKNYHLPIKYPPTTIMTMAANRKRS